MSTSFEVETDVSDLAINSGIFQGKTTLSQTKRHYSAEKASALSNHWEIGWIL